MKTFKASPQQQAFFDWIVNGTGSCVLKAVAGAGKTTTLIESLNLMKGNIFFGAYNKKIATEIAERAPKSPTLKISTMHAAGFGAWRRVAKNVVVNQYKCRDIFRNTIGMLDEEHAKLETPVVDLVSYAKQAAFGVVKQIADKSAWMQLIEHFDVDCAEQDDVVVELAQQLIKLSVKNDMKEIDFDDMILAPLVHHTQIFQNDWVLIDEAQDTNASRRALALMMLKRGGRLIAVGDPHQAIYGFTGADADSLELIGKAVTAIDMPLTVTYRCPKAVVKYAQQWVNHIEAHESAPEGVVRPMLETETLLSVARVNDAILCRFNAPLIKHVYQFIAAGIPAKVEGRDIGNGLKALIRRWKTKSYNALINKLESFQEKECAKYRAKEMESKAVAVEDKVACIKILIERTQRVNPAASNVIDALCVEIDKIFDDSVNSGHVVLTSIHKSKGREWSRVLWLQTGASPWARKDWELVQEANLCYVAATRAKSELILVTKF